MAFFKKKDASEKPAKKKKEKKAKKEFSMPILKWFSIKGIFKEIKRIRWPKPGALMKDSGIVIVFGGCFALYFVICTLIDAGILNLLGIGA